MSSLIMRRQAIALPATHRPKMSFKTLAIAAGALIGATAAIAYGYHWWSVGRFIESTDDAYVGGDITAIAPRVNGLITDVAVHDNQPVRKDELLVKLDDRDYRAALAKAEAAVAAQQAALANLDAQRHLQQAKVAEAAAAIGAANAEVTRTREDVARYRQLASSRFASVQRLQQVDADHKKAVAAIGKAQAALQAAQRAIAVIDTRKQQVRAALAEAEANRDIARLSLGYTQVRAPFDGTVGNRSARTGAYATAGAALLSLVPAHGLWVDANFKENQLAHLRQGQPVTIRADVLPGRVFRGHVASVAPATGAEFSVLPPENATGNFTKIVQRVPLRVRLDGDAATLGLLRPGLSVTADVDERAAGSVAP